MDLQTEDILRGRFNDENQPCSPVKIVRIYLASNGSDSRTERTSFIQHVYPHLREYCRQEYGVEFQVVDLEWGLSSNEFAPERLKQREVLKCQNLSCGPSLIIFLGQKYGTKELPTTIAAEEFEAYKNVLKQSKSRDTRTTFLLDDWYMKDFNNLPPVYLFKEPPDYFTQLENKSNTLIGQNVPGTTDGVKLELLRLLDKARSLMIEEQASGSNQFQKSQFDRNINLALETCKNTQERCILIKRNIIDLHNYVEEEIASDFVELFYDENEDELRPCEISKMQLEAIELKTVNALSKENVISKDVLWRYNEVISPELHQEYLKELCVELVERLKFQIDCLVSSSPDSSKSTEVVEEVSRHWARCYDVAGRFYGRRPLVERIHNYLESETKQPLLIHGPSGCGKTKLISKVATETNHLLGYHTITIVRFIGYSVASSTSRQLLVSISSQICSALDIDDTKVPDEITSVQRYLNHLITTFPEKERLVIYLDALEQLVTESDDMFAWLPETLPSNVKIIISCHTQSPRTLLLMNRSCILEMTKLNSDECLVLLSHFLSRWNRAITSKQKIQIREIFNKCSAPIFVKLLANKLKNMTSFENIDMTKLPIDIDDGIDFLLTNLEMMHGKTFVGRCLGSLVASKSGLSDCEIDDVLSLDDEVLNEVYTEYQPSLKRIPPVKWLYLKESLEGFLCSFDSDGVQVNMVKHACLIKTITERYLRTEQQKEKQHSVLADYFLGSWSNRPKPLHYPDSSFPESEADRYVISQPLTFRTNGLTRFNKRKYDQLPRHLKGAERLQEMNRIVFFNYDWIYSKMKALSLEHILEDFALNPSEEARLVQEALRQGQSTIETNIDNLGPEIIGRLLPYYSELDNIRSLIKQCELNGLSNCCFIPNLPYSNTPGSALKSIITCPIVPECLALVNSDILCKKKEDCYVYVYSVSTGQLKDRVFTSNGDLYSTPNGQLLAIFDHITGAAIKIHETATGRFRGQIIVTSCLDDLEGVTIGQIKVSNDSLCTHITTKSELSYLVIADLNSCLVDKLIRLEGKTTFCEISPDQRVVMCNSDDHIYCYNLKTYMENFNTQFEFRPHSIRFSNDMTFLYVCNSQLTSIVCMNLLDFGMIPVAKRNVQDDTYGNQIDDFRVSNDDSSVLVRSKTVIVVYDSALCQLKCEFRRPEKIPQEFKLPKRQYKNIFFSDAQFSQDSRFVLGTIFRIVFIWRLDGILVASVSTPVGIITSLLVSSELKQFITHAESLPEIQVWDISSATKKAMTTDRLTSSVKKIEVNIKNDLIFIQCHKSDEIGIIDMKTGVMVDLLTHAQNVEDFAITPSGKYVLVTMQPRLSNSAVNIWDTESRKIIREFGNTVVKCLPCHQNEMFYFISQDVVSHDAPYFVHTISVEDSCIKEQKHHRALKFLLDDPFITANDNYLVALSAESFKGATAEYINIAMCIFCLNSDLQLVCHSPETIPGSHDIGSIVTVRPCPGLDNTVAIFYQPKKVKFENFESHYPIKDAKIGICLFDISNETITNKFDPLTCTVNKIMISKQLFSDDYSICLTDSGSLVDLSTRREVRLRSFSRQRLLAVQNTVVVFHEDSVLYAFRISDKTLIGTCEVYSTICYLKLCSDDHTVLVGCPDGTVTSYTVINDLVDSPKEVIGKILSRQSDERSDTPDELLRSWDKLEKYDDVVYRRPPSARMREPKDKLHLQNIEPVPQNRPLSAKSTYSSNSISNSRTCAVM